ncbi:MAG: class I SAM-dependent methyltransferase [Candidatus Saccharibacteria bacterium]|nr:class I SAM-dependent methyltransferase [Candidatus Saccharibacteria bacterium]
MSLENQKTLETYSTIGAQKYLENNTKRDPKHASEKRKILAKNIGDAFSSLPTGAKVLEVGAADGDNSKILESLGFDVTASDIAPAFLEACKKNGLKTIKFNLLEDEFPADLSGLFAWRVFVHFTHEDVLLALSRAYNALLPGGRFMFNVIDRATHNVTEEIVDFSGDYNIGAGRYYAYYDRDEIVEMAAKAGFRIIKDWHEHGGHNDWFCFVLEK